MKQNKDVNFILIGDGPLKSSVECNIIKSRFAGNVTFTGLVDHDNAKKYLAVCDIFLCPTLPNKDGSRFFGSPTKLFEYMSLAKPVIVSDLEQLAEVVEPSIKISEFNKKNIDANKTAGIKIAPDDHVALAEAILWLSNTSEKCRQKIGNNAREKVLKNYTWDKNIEALEEFFDGLEEEECKQKS